MNQYTPWTLIYNFFESSVLTFLFLKTTTTTTKQNTCCDVMEQFPSNSTISFQILFVHTLLCQYNCFVSVQLLNISYTL